MADIKDQLIKDSYNYVLQSDLSTGVVYRIGGLIPVNPIFQSGLTINDSFTYSNGTEQNGYVLLTDGTGYAYWGPVSGASPSSGVTSITVGNGLSASSSTGAVTITFTGSTGVSGDYLPLSGGTVTGNTIFQSGLTANTISATTITSTNYQNLPFSGTVIGNGTTNYLPKWTGTTGLGNSLIYDNGTNIGIGTTSPSAKVDINVSTGGTIGVRISGDSSSDMLRITQTGSGNAIVVEDSSNPDSTPFVVTSGGTIGIGTISPQYFLEAVTTGGVDAVMLFDGGTGANSNLVARADTTGKLPVLVLSDRNNTYGVSTSYYIALDRSTSSLFAGRNDAIYVNNYQDKGHYFVTNNGGSKGTRMSILNTGNVGIGTTLPSEKLHVSGNTIISGTLTATTISATTYQNLPLSGLTSGSGIGLSNSNGNYTISFTGSSSSFTGGTVTGPTTFTNGLTATTKTTIGSEGDISCALLQMASTTQGILFPRMTNAQRQSISSPIPGLFVYCTDDDGINNREGLFMYKSSGWVQIL